MMRRLLQAMHGRLWVVAALIVNPGWAAAAQNAGSITGQILDEQGAVIVGTTLSIVDSKGVAKTSKTNEEGSFRIEGLAAGKYTLRVAAEGFAPYEKSDVEVTAGHRQVLNITLTVAIVTGEISVNPDSQLVSASPDKTANTIVLKGSELESLPDDPEDLANALQAMAGQSAGPNGGQLYVDGFASSQLPAKISIREIRINQNPIAAENDSPGIGRIDIFTQPGADKLRGSAFFSFMDGRLNSRNPFSSNKLPFHRRQFGGVLSGKLVPGKLSFALDFQRQDQGESQLISATVLDGPNLDVVPLRLSVLTPREITSFSPRFDYQISTNHTLMARYSFSTSTSENQGVGGFNLESRAFDLSNRNHTLRLTETSVLGPSTVNEIRFQYANELLDLKGDNSQPTVDVLQAFSGGGSQIGHSTHRVNRWEFENYTARAFQNHTMKFGGRVRGVRVEDISDSNFGGAFVYAGGLAAALDENNQIMPNQSEVITSIERFRRTNLFLDQGLTFEEMRARGGGATQFSINIGNPRATVNWVDFGGFIQDDWRLRPNLTLSLGLRYENQSTINSNFDFGPRIALAWAPTFGSGSQPSKTVVRGGFGIFYDRFGENLVLQTRRFNGTNQQQFVVHEPNFLTVPPVDSLGPDAGESQIVRRVADDYRSPYSLFTALQLERQLPGRITVSALYFRVRAKHVLRQRDINAPLPGTFVVGDPTSGERPFGDIGEIFLYESSGIQNEHRLQVTVNGRIGRLGTFFSNYTLADGQGDAEGNFPANQYDPAADYGRLSTSVRHRFAMGGSFNIPLLRVTLNPLIIARSGFPFNITTGRDTNGDTLFTDRPAFASDLTRTSVVQTHLGDFDLDPLPEQQMIPRNFATGPAFFSVNLGLSKAFSFDSFRGRSHSAASGKQSKGPSVLIPGSGRSNSRESRYRLLAAVNCENLFNRANGAIPVGNLSSTLFGQSIQSAGPFGGGILQSANRRIRLQLRLEF